MNNYSYIIAAPMSRTERAVIERSMADWEAGRPPIAGALAGGPDVC